MTFQLRVYILLAAVGFGWLLFCGWAVSFIVGLAGLELAVWQGMVIVLVTNALFIGWRYLVSRFGEHCEHHA